MRARNSKGEKLRNPFKYIENERRLTRKWDKLLERERRANAEPEYRDNTIGEIYRRLGAVFDIWEIISRF